MRSIILSLLILLGACSRGGENLLLNTAQLGANDCAQEPDENNLYRLGFVVLETQGTTVFLGATAGPSGPSSSFLRFLVNGSQLEPRAAAEGAFIETEVVTVEVYATTLDFGSAEFVVHGTVATPIQSFIEYEDTRPYRRTFSVAGCLGHVEPTPEEPPVVEIPTRDEPLSDKEGKPENWDLENNFLADGTTYKSGQLDYDPEPQSPYRWVSLLTPHVSATEDGGIQDRQVQLIHDLALDGAVTMVRIAMLAEVTFDFPANMADLTPVIYQENDSGIRIAYLAGESFTFLKDQENPEFRALEVNLPANKFTDPFTGNHPDFSAKGKPLTFGYELMARPHNGNTYLDIDEFEIEFDAPTPK